MFIYIKASKFWNDMFGLRLKAEKCHFCAIGALKCEYSHCMQLVNRGCGDHRGCGSKAPVVCIHVAAATPGSGGASVPVDC